MAQATVTLITDRLTVHPAPIRVERGIPLPARKHHHGRNHRRYPWDAMAVGDSFFVACSKEAQAKTQRSVASAAAYWSRRHSGHFTVRKVEGGLRVWRVRADRE